MADADLVSLCNLPDEAAQRVVRGLLEALGSLGGQTMCVEQPASLKPEDALRRLRRFCI